MRPARSAAVSFSCSTRPEGSLLCRLIHSENRVRGSTAYSMHILGDERPAALLDPHQAAARQFLQRAAHGVAVDCEMLRQFRFGRQPAAGRVCAGADILLQMAGDLPPQGHAFVAQHRMSRAVVGVARQSHGFVTQAPPVRAISQLTIPRRAASCLDICISFGRSQCDDEPPAPHEPACRAPSLDGGAGARRGRGAGRAAWTGMPCVPLYTAAARAGGRSGDGARPRRRRRRAVQPGRDDGDALHGADRVGAGRARLCRRARCTPGGAGGGARCDVAGPGARRCIAREGDRAAGGRAAGTSRRDRARRRRRPRCSSSPCGTCAHERRISIACPASPIRSPARRHVFAPCWMRWRGRARCYEVGHGLTPPAPLAPATAAVLLTLVDHDTPVWLDPAAARGARLDRVPLRCADRAGALRACSFALALSLPELGVAAGRLA